VEENPLTVKLKAQLTCSVALSSSDPNCSNSQDRSREAEDKSKYIACGHSNYVSMIEILIDADLYLHI
jgi:hypothetical protein